MKYSQGNANSERCAIQERCDAKFNQELTLFFQQGGVEVAAKLLNALGSAESFEVSALMGGSEIKSTAPKHSQIRGEYVQPEVRGLPFDLVVSADSTSNKPLGDAPYEEISLGGAVRVKSTRGSVAGNGLEFEWFARQRDILPSRGGSEKGDDIESYTYSAPQEIVALARPSIKSAVAVQYGFNAQQPSSLNPRTGRAGFGRLEFAYPNLTGGDVGLLSLSGKMKSSQIVFPESDVSLTVALEAALLRPLGPNDVVHLSDRLFLGGPMFLRGFQPRGCGPRSGDGKAALGGTNRWQARVGLEGPPPPFEFLHSTTRTHAFLAAGALSNEFSFKSLLKDDLRLSCGFGLAFAIVIGRIEANVAYAIKAKEFDALSGRLQFGVGGEFL